ncbi:unnamed protein product, partial [marine sediment metagenome]
GLVWKHKLCHYDEATIGNALRRQRMDEPDATKPAWKPIYRGLAELGHKDGKSPLTVLLTQVREAAKEYGVRGVDEWTDADAWHHHLRTQIQDYYLPFAARTDAESAAAWRKRTCEDEYRIWRDALTEGGWDTPTYLAEETVPPTAPGPVAELQADPQMML